MLLLLLLLLLLLHFGQWRTSKFTLPSEKSMCMGFTAPAWGDHLVSVILCLQLNAPMLARFTEVQSTLNVQRVIRSVLCCLRVEKLQNQSPFCAEKYLKVASFLDSGVAESIWLLLTPIWDWHRSYWPRSVCGLADRPFLDTSLNFFIS